MSFRDESRYQAADRSGTFVENPKCNTLVYEDFDEYQHRYTLRQAQIGLDDQHRVLWREQFDSISKDFIASLDEETVSKLQSKLINRFQKWWSLFGKYWLVKNAYNNDDTKLMKWLMTGANHRTIDMCGKNVSHSLVLRMCVNRDVARSITINNMVQHHTNEVIWHLTRNVKAIFPIMPLDIQDMLDRSPSMVVHDFIRMWSMMNQRLPGIGLTTPAFSDRATDYEPWKIGPKFFLSPLPMQMHSCTKDPMYRLHSSFIYLPEQF